MKHIRLALVLMVCAGLLTACKDQSYEDKKGLIKAVEQFYEMILATDTAALYDYLPQSFKDQVTKEQFLASVAGQPVSFVFNAFALMKIQRYKIHAINKTAPGTFEVTVYIYPENNLQKMADIMTWKKQDSRWVNVTYADLVAGMIENVRHKQRNVMEQVFELKQCKNELQEFILALFEFISAYNMALSDFVAVAPEGWLSALNKEGKFVSGVPICPAGGVYSVTYDRSARKLIFYCSKHTSIAIPFEFSDMTAPISAPQQGAKPEGSTP